MACVKGCSLIKLGDLGALAVLKGSGFGLYTPHRGGRASYSMTPGHIRIPVAAVTNEDMTLFDQVHKLGKLQIPMLLQYLIDIEVLSKILRVPGIFGE